MAQASSVVTSWLAGLKVLALHSTRRTASNKLSWEVEVKFRKSIVPGTHKAFGNMPTRTVIITARADGTREPAEMLVCPECDGQRFFVYVPSSIGHIHFQCFHCGTSFCDGCTADAAEEVKHD